MSSLEFVRTLFEMKAFIPLNRNDSDVDIAKVHHYVHNKQDIDCLEYTDAIVELINEKIFKQSEKEHKYYYVYKMKMVKIRRHLLEKIVVSNC